VTECPNHYEDSTGIRIMYNAHCIHLKDYMYRSDLQPETDLGTQFQN